MEYEDIERLAIESGLVLDGQLCQFASLLLQVQHSTVQTQHEILCEIKEIVQNPAYWTNSDSTAFHRGYILGTIEANMSIEEPDDENPVSHLGTPESNTEEIPKNTH